MKRIISYFNDSITSQMLDTIGVEVETQFLDENNDPISVHTSQQMFAHLVGNGWQVVHRQGSLIPDERDAIWLELDGRTALAPLARIASVQFTISVSPNNAINILNKLSSCLDIFLQDYPQDQVWKRYIRDSAAKYRSDRYGGPLAFSSLGDYCCSLIQHDVVQGSHLVPFAKVSHIDIPLYLRSIWWYFRLKRYGNSLCIEVRPMARKEDKEILRQL
ncbi:MAG: hypothetical protein CO133_00115, partial [Candidatus Komeilibacteria bacterium CG_4_9_14_3_um_filter_37_5]